MTIAFDESFAELLPGRLNDVRIVREMIFRNGVIRSLFNNLEMRCNIEAYITEQYDFEISLSAVEGEDGEFCQSVITFLENVINGNGTVPEEYADRLPQGETEQLPLILAAFTAADAAEPLATETAQGSGSMATRFTVVTLLLPLLLLAMCKFI